MIYVHLNTWGKEQHLMPLYKSDCEKLKETRIVQRVYVQRVRVYVSSYSTEYVLWNTHFIFHLDTEELKNKFIFSSVLTIKETRCITGEQDWCWWRSDCNSHLRRESTLQSDLAAVNVCVWFHYCCSALTLILVDIVLRYMSF